MNNETNNKTSKASSLIPYLQLAIGAVMVSFSAVFVRLTSTAPTVDGFYRMLFGGVILLLIALFRKETLWPNNTKVFGFILLSGLMFALDLTFWHRSIDYIGPGLATIIVNLQVFVLAFVGIYFHGEGGGWRFALAIPLAIVGMYFLVGYEWHTLAGQYKIGIGLCFIAMVFYTIYILAIHQTRTLNAMLPAIANLALISLFSAACLGIIATFQGEAFFNFGHLDLIWLILYGIFGQVLGWLLISMGLGHCKISIAGFILLLQPALAFIWDITLFHRPTPFIEILGSIITLFAIYLSSTAKQ